MWISLLESNGDGRYEPVSCPDFFFGWKNTGLPPTYINVGDLDLFLDENIDYARKLLSAGVPTEIHVYPGAFHGSNMFVSRSSLSKRWRDDEQEALKRALFE